MCPVDPVVDRASESDVGAHSYSREGRGKGKGRPPGLRGKEIGTFVNKAHTIKHLKSLVILNPIVGSRSCVP
jgi:hypothetical protein